MEIHEVCNIFPMMSPKEFEDLKEDIAENGVLMPIWTYHGKVIDGRNRVKAVEELGLGIQYKTKEWRGRECELVSFVVSLNKHRRHLTQSQLACVL
jgi:ParB-like chromosome segregation protein Spo0J